MKRLAIYVFWEKEGVVREYVKYYLRGLQDIAEKVIVVANGGMKFEGKRELENMGIVVLERENVGVDFWAYKYGMDNEENYQDIYDQVILANCSCYGPVYPFSEMFAEMEKKSLDFWGITEWPENESGYVGTWVLSYFMVFNKKIIISDDWKTYWDNLCEVHSREECIDLHETKFTKHFSDLGYKYGVYCENTPDFIDLTIEAPDFMVEKQRCPIIKRKAFCAEYNRFLSFHRGNASRNVFEYIKENKLYDTDIILDDLLATQHYDSVKNCLQLNYILSEESVSCSICNEPKVVICFHMYYEDLLDSSCDYLLSAPDYADIFITTPKKELLPIIRKKCNDRGLERAKIELIPARGRAESAFLVGTKDFIMEYDYACIVHDKKSSFLRPGIIGREFGLHNLDGLLKSKEYVANVISLLESNPRLGMLIPFNLLYANYRELYGMEWGANYEGTVKFLQDFEVDVPISQDVQPVCPMGAMFWIRPKSMKTLIEKSWEYSDFPEEPLPLDGSLIHIIERAYPYFIQKAGYLTAWISSDRDAAVYTTDIAYLYRNTKINLRHIEAEKAMFENDANNARKELELVKNDMAYLDDRIDRYAIKRYIKRKIKKYLHIK